MYTITQTLLSLAAIITVSQALVANLPRTAGKQVNTTSGLVTGRAAPGYPLLSEYLGIPFAEPPVDALRFAPPKPYTAKGPITANKQPLSCTQSVTHKNYSLPQPAQDLLGPTIASTLSGEDCLFLNVWSPEDGNAKKPVLLWIFGGGFHAGGAADLSEQGGLFAHEQGIVLVSFNYRLGIFGFPGAPGLTQNLGLLDQRLAVEWVRDNIAAFGGDPTRITIFGHSAGGASADYYSYAWKDDPIVVGAISMSGSTTSFGHRTAATGAEAFDATAQLLGCGSSNTTSSSAVMSCVMGKSTAEVYNASITAGDTVKASLSTADQFYVGITGIWSPTIDNQVVFSNYSLVGQQGQFMQRPFMTGNNNDEACLFSEKGQIPVANDSLLTEQVFTCPMNWAATYRASAKLPTWKYRWFGAYPNLELNDCPGQPWHSQEVFVLFGSAVTITGIAPTPREIAAGIYLRTAWAAFARDPTKDLTTEMKWPTFNSNESAAIELGLNSTMLRVANATSIDALCFTPYFLYGGPSY